MCAVVLAICPGLTTGYAIVHGERAHAVGSWILLADVGPWGTTDTVHDLRPLIAARRLEEAVEHEAMRYSVDAVVVANPSGGWRNMRSPFMRAVARAAYRANCPDRVVDPDCWLQGRQLKSEPMADIGVLAMGVCAADRISVPCLEAALAVVIGRYGSSKMGILPIDAMNDLGV